MTNIAIAKSLHLELIVRNFGTALKAIFNKNIIALGA
jgi:hypothetical protein